MRKLNREPEVITIYKEILEGKRKQFPLNYWNRPQAKDDAKIITRYLIEEVLKVRTVDIPKYIKARTFLEYKLYGMLQLIYDTKPFKAIDSVYPKRFKLWQFKVPSNYWNEDTAKEAIKWLVEERCLFNPVEAREKLEIQHFRRNGLYSLLVTRFNRNTILALNKAYEGE